MPKWRGQQATEAAPQGKGRAHRAAALTRLIFMHEHQVDWLRLGGLCDNVVDEVASHADEAGRHAMSKVVRVAHVSLKHVTVLDPRLLVQIEQEGQRLAALLDCLQIRLFIDDADRWVTVRQRILQLLRNAGRAGVAWTAPEDERFWKHKLGQVDLTRHDERER